VLIVAVRGRAGSSMAACWWVRPTKWSGGRDVPDGSCALHVGSPGHTRGEGGRPAVRACGARGIAGVGHRSVRTHGVVQRRSTRAPRQSEPTIMNQIECRVYITVSGFRDAVTRIVTIACAREPTRTHARRSDAAVAECPAYTPYTWTHVKSEPGASGHWRRGPGDTRDIQ
jgi:hypothetical protein